MCIHLCHVWYKSRTAITTLCVTMCYSFIIPLHKDLEGNSHLKRQERLENGGEQACCNVSSGSAGSWLAIGGGGETNGSISLRSWALGWVSSCQRPSAAFNTKQMFPASLVPLTLQCCTNRTIRGRQCQFERSGWALCHTEAFSNKHTPAQGRIQKCHVYLDAGC